VMRPSIVARISQKSRSSFALSSDALSASSCAAIVSRFAALMIASIRGPAFCDASSSASLASLIAPWSDALVASTCAAALATAASNWRLSITKSRSPVRTC